MNNNNFRESLDSYQCQVFDTRARGVYRVSASPGSGKTRLLTRIIASMIQNDRVLPSDIFVCTFSNRARAHVADGINSLLVSQRLPLTTTESKDLDEFLHENVTTIHAQSSKLLNLYYRGRGNAEVSFFDETEVRLFVAKWAARHLCTDGIAKTLSNENNNTDKGDNEELWEQVEQLCRWMSRFFAMYWNPADSCRSIARWKFVGKISQFWMDRLRRLCTDLVAHCESLHRYTYDMMIVKLQYAIVSDIQFRRWCAQRYRYIFVDEAQDLDCRQAQIIYSMSSHHRNLMMIGDPWQNMYRFRGSDACWMTNKLDEYWRHQQPPVTVVEFYLPFNYRSHPSIVKTVQHITPHVQMKSMKQQPQPQPQGNDDDDAVVHISKHEQELRFMQEVVTVIRKTVQAGSLKWSDWMILSRYQNSCTLIREFLRQFDIPTTDLSGGDKNKTSDEVQKNPTDAVIVCTFHAAKGLENKAVVVNLLSYLQQQEPISQTTPPSPLPLQTSSPVLSPQTLVSELLQQAQIKLWTVPFLTPLASNSTVGTQISSSSNSTTDEKKTAVAEEPEHPERANIRVALSRPHDYLFVGLPSNVNHIKNKSVSNIIQELASINLNEST